MKSPETFIDRFNLIPLEGEGGLWAPLFRAESSSAIYFMMMKPDFSAWHRIPENELWVHLAGSPTILYTVDESGPTPKVEKRRLWADDGHLEFTVPASTWMAAKPEGEWSMVLCSLVPAFSSMELARPDLIERWAQHLDSTNAFDLAGEVRELQHA